MWKKDTKYRSIYNAYIGYMVFHKARSAEEMYEYVVAVNGSVDITLEDINGRRDYRLDSKEKGLLIPPDTWDELRNFSPDAVLLVLASHSYNPDTYINSYDEFLEYIKSKKSNQ